LCSIPFSHPSRTISLNISNATFSKTWHYDEQDMLEQVKHGFPSAELFEHITTLLQQWMDTFKIKLMNWSHT
jgi:hypothetical protein